MNDAGYTNRALLLLNSLISAAEKRHAQLMRRGDTASAREIRRALLVMVYARRRLASGAVKK